MPDIANYTETTELVLGETGKYFALVLFAVLAIRLWCRQTKGFAADKLKNLFLACLATGIACAIGYFSMRQSLASLYSHYGMEAFHENRLLQSLSLFETSSEYWKNPDTLGEEGFCLLYLGKPDDGESLIAKAASMRKGSRTSFENFYEGLYFFTQGQKSNAVPLLQAASADGTYLWSATKLFAIMLLDENRAADAADWMKPYMQAEVTESEQAYIVASLKLADGKKAAAQAVLNKFPSAEEDQSLAGKARFEKLRAQIHN
ncbi:MAG TPA: hypothetical protein VGH42_10270 [Verrucomicrobiae bacterium]|jgi:hypothetical protein